MVAGLELPRRAAAAGTCRAISQGCRGALRCAINGATGEEAFLRGRGRAQLGEALLDTHLTLPPEGAVFDPRRVDIGQIQRVQEVSVGVVARAARLTE